jgi:chloride channel protein, CIC family
VLFALEEIVGDLHARVLGAVVVSSVTAWVVLHLFLGDEPLFHVPAYRLVHPAELGVYAVLGGVGGVASVLFVKLLLALRGRFLRLNPSRAWLHPVVGGLTVGLLGFFVPEVLGVGYDYIERVLNGDVVLRVLVLLAALRIVATAVCYASGNAGGIFGPSLFIGGTVGGAVGAVAHACFPASTAEPGAYALVGMGDGLCRHRADAAHVRHHDFRADARLHDHRAADDFESDRVLHLASSAAGPDL